MQTHDTIDADRASKETAKTMAAGADDIGASLPPNRTRGGSTVLPGVERREGQKVLVPRDQPRYEVNKVLGEGGMGVVELARDADIGRKVAIKRLRSQAAASPTSLARFVEEVRTVGGLDHPGIAPIHDVGLDADGSFFFVMKYIEGETLEDVIKGLQAGDAELHRRMGFDQRVGLVLSVLNALDYAHSAGLLHRDLKPANVMIGRYGEVLLVDWGIARPIGGDPDPEPTEAVEETGDDDGRTRLVATRAGALIGTPLYMSPEQARGVTAGLDARSDVFSLGMLMAELLALRHPLEGKRGVVEICGALQTFEMPPVHTPFWDHPQQPPVPSEYRHFLKKALALDPNDRYQSAGEMLAALTRVRAGDFAAQCPATFVKRMQYGSLGFVDKHPLLSNFLLLFVALSVLSSVGGALLVLLR
ncbi:MAG: serine/threonine-protein kinase [Sandaracinaceae bacterium]